MKSKLYQIEEVVKNVLEWNEETRSDDFILIYRVYQKINENAVVRMPFYEVMLNHKEYGLPAFEGITRARRKIQKEYPYLSNEKVREQRINATADYIRYAIDNNYDASFMKLVDSKK